MTEPSPRRGWVFVDSSAFVAVALRRDENHEMATRIASSLIGTRRLTTTSLVAAETHGYLVSRMGRDGARAVLRQIDDEVEVILVTGKDGIAGRAILDRYADKDFSLTDAVSFAVMDRLGLRAAFAFDRHFAQYGLDVLTAQ